MSIDETVHAVKMKKDPTRVATFLASGLRKLLYDVEVEGEDVVKALKGESAVYLMRHGDWKDIPAIGCYLFDTNSSLNTFAMKYTIPFRAVIEQLGGVSYIRGVDARKLGIRNPKPHNDAATRGLAVHMLEDNVLIFYPQGTRANYNKPAHKFNRVIEMQEIMREFSPEVKLPFVPVDVEYHSGIKARLKLSFKEPVYADSTKELAEAWNLAIFG